MPEYLSPGVYVEEVDLGSKPIEGVGTSTAGMLGPTERGPTAPQLVTGFGQFSQVYGGFFKDSWLPYAVDGFFRNGGQRCFIGRIVGSGAVPATGHLKDAAPGAADLIEVNALGPGTWGNSVELTVGEASLAATRAELFKLTISYKGASTLSPDIEEVYDNLSPNPTASEFFERHVNGVSRLISLTQVEGASPTTPPAAKQTLTLASGTDGGAVDKVAYEGITTPGQRTGLAAFEEVDEIAILGIPDEHDTTIASVTGSLIDHCEKLKDRFAVVAVDQGQSAVANIRVTVEPKRDTKYAAVYYPWIRVLDPVSGVAIKIPPTGHVMGIYARSDVERGVHKAPANEVVRGAVDLEFNTGKGEQDILNPRGVNVIRAFPGRGIRVWGARTMSSDGAWKYLNVRRLFIFLEESIDEGTQWAVFEPNDTSLWERLRGSVTAFLTTQWRAGALQGTTPEQAFFVKVGLGETMTQDDIDNGRVIMLIGVAPVKPAEFVIFRITQMPRGSALSE
jgi:uncharacterized protein